MGFLTTFTINNDGIDKILKNSNEFCEKLYNRALKGVTTDFGHGGYANLVKVQKARHANDPTIYAHMRNTVCEMNACSQDTETLMRENPEFFKDMLDYLRQEVGDLEKKFGEYQTKVKSQE